MEDLVDRANRGDVEAQLEVGFNYLRGKNGFPEDDAKAFTWFKQAADNNNAMGMCMVGEMYQYGYGVPWDYEAAVSWYLLSARLECGRAEFRLGWLYAQPISKSRHIVFSRETAAKYYDRAWRHGFKDGLGIIQSFIEDGIVSY